VIGGKERTPRKRPGLKRTHRPKTPHISQTSRGQIKKATHDVGGLRHGGEKRNERGGCGRRRLLNQESDSEKAALREAGAGSLGKRGRGAGEWVGSVRGLKSPILSNRPWGREKRKGKDGFSGNENRSQYVLVHTHQRVLYCVNRLAKGGRYKEKKGTLERSIKSREQGNPLGPNLCETADCP